MTPPTSGTAGRARLSQLLEPVLAETGIDLEDVTISPAGKRRIVRVIVDRDGGISLDDVAGVSRTISDALDEADEADPTLLGGAYVLEVSSPGVDRPLTAGRHWHRATTRLVSAELASGETVLGRVTSTDEFEAVLDVDGAERRLLLAEVVRANVQVEFARSGTGSDDAALDEDVDPVHDQDEEGEHA